VPGGYRLKFSSQLQQIFGNRIVLLGDGGGQAPEMRSPLAEVSGIAYGMTAVRLFQYLY
jgi:hypothetical protein